MSRAAKTAPTPTSPITAVATGIAQTVLAQTSNRQLKLPNNLHRSTDAVSRSRPAWPSANALRQLAFTQAHRPRRSNPHRFSIPRFPPLEVFRRRPAAGIPGNQSQRPASENLHKTRRTHVEHNESGLHPKADSDASIADVA